MTAIMILAIVLSNSAGDIFITKGMKQVGEVSTLNPSALFKIAWSVLRNWNFLLGIGCLAVSFFSFITVLAWEDLSFIVPATSIVYVISIIGAKVFLKEEISPLRWAGSMLVCLGVALVCLP